MVRRTMLMAVNRFALRLVHHVTIEGPGLTLPDSGPAIIAANHTSPLDPLFIQAQTWRHIRWVMAREYLELPMSGWFWEAAEVIPVARDGKDSAAARAALRVLADGGVVGIFPEGRISPSREMLPVETGISLLAVKSGAPLYPVWIDGTQRGASMLSAVVQPQETVLRFGTSIRAISGAGGVARIHKELVDAFDLLKT